MSKNTGIYVENGLELKMAIHQTVNYEKGSGN
jgi:hypothetical protein